MIARALRWSLLASVLGAIVQLGVAAALSRMLGPLEFGLVAAAALAMRFISHFSQLGLGPALIQRSNVEPGHWSAALVVAICTGAASWATFMLLAAPIALFFREPTLDTVLMLAPAGLLLAAVAGVPQARLRRQMRFKAIASIDLLAQVVGYAGVGISLAALGWGVWSLVLAAIAQQAVALLGYGAAARMLPLASMTRQHMRDLVGYGSSYSLVGLLDFISSSVETLFIGRVLGVPALGIYNRAQSVCSTPADLFRSAISRVTFPALAAMRLDKYKLREAVLLSIHLSTMLTLPVACGMSIAADNLVLVLLGPQWIVAVDLARVLIWAMPASYISMLAGSTADILAKFQAKGVMIVTICLFKLAMMWVLGESFGLTGVAVGVVLAEWVRALSLLVILRRIISLPVIDVLAHLWHGTLIGGAVSVALLLMAPISSHLLADLGHYRAAALGAQAIAASTVFFVLARACTSSVLARHEGRPFDLSALRRFARL